MEQLLIIEDDKGLNQGLSKALKTDDRFIISCQDLKSAREQLLCSKVSLVLLDVNLPDGNGLELLQEIKENTPDVPVIMLTANDTDIEVDLPGDNFAIVVNGDMAGNEKIQDVDGFKCKVRGKSGCVLVNKESFDN